MAEAKKVTKATATKKLTKAGLVDAIVALSPEGTTRAQVKGLLGALTAVGYKELRKSGLFILPGFAKLVVVRKPARPAREGINPFTKQPTTFTAKPASKAVRARPVKALKDAVA